MFIQKHCFVHSNFMKQDYSRCILKSRSLPSMEPLFKLSNNFQKHINFKVTSDLAFLLSSCTMMSLEIVCQPQLPTSYLLSPQSDPIVYCFVIQFLEGLFTMICNTYNCKVIFPKIILKTFKFSCNIFHQFQVTPTSNLNGY